ncbi:barstar family protein [Candidatus Accumulibacter phosphatis]|uniref:Barstar (barnase inhibitor) domain-containing protein n=1 Tax=Candidatus Accumulibacter phosphatis TaxID=327160 RepID=A0A5S4F625_9PROT|nr:barstar family protein [Candidatus Accumulibacter phosphatis]TMQ76193.1 hypothetical protein ACCUM_4569 [Candidatus Accumulibacter phosphatis]
MSQNDLQNLLVDAIQAGIYHLPVTAHRVVKAAAEAAGLACFDVSFDDSDCIDSVLSTLGRDLDLPEWYGHNLDALKDCLTDFSWFEAAGYVLIITRAEILQAQDPVSFHAVNEVFAAAIAEWRLQDLPMWVFYDLRADGLAALPTLA